MAEDKDVLQQRAQLLFKLLDPYLDKYHQRLSSLADLQDHDRLPIFIHASCQQRIADFLSEILHCNVSKGKDRFGQYNGCLMVSLANNRINQTTMFAAALALQRLGLALPVSVD